MKISLALCLVVLTVSVYSENCPNNVSDCHETQCATNHGWWLQCKSGICVCSHKTYTGQACGDGGVATCRAIHDSRCTDHGLKWHCVDSVCHCSKL